MNGRADSRLTLVLGGVSSGKSAFAESLLEADPHPVYLATAEALDEDLRARIERHRRRRGPRWQTIEAPLDLGAVLRAETYAERALLLDSLGMWLNNVLHAERDLDAETTDLLESLAASRARIVVVSDEVGLGGVAQNELARRFTDHLGRLHQRVAAIADRVYLVAAGIPLLLKPER